MKSKDELNVKLRKEAAFEIEGPYRMNIPLLLLTFILICFGLIMLFSASMSKGYTEEQDPLFYLINQGQMTFVGIIFVAVLLFIPIRFFDRWPFIVAAYFFALAFVIYTWKFGEIYGGSRRWVSIAGRSFQPSELVKIVMVFFIAGYRSLIIRLRKSGKFQCQNPKWQGFLDGMIDIVLPASAILICLAFVVMQPHMSCFIIVLAISAICFLVSGISIRSWLYGGMIMGAILAVLLSAFLLFAQDSDKEKLSKNFEHVFKRLDIFNTLQSEEDGENDVTAADENEVYQNKQAIIAIGSGGVSGVGFGNSRQKYMYLPEAHNDFVYAIACEELGFIGGLSIIALFWAFLCGGLSIAWKANSDFSRILAVGYTTLISLQAFLNIGVAMGAIPPTGISLPFFSSGGSANLFFLIAVGLLLSVSRSGVKRKKMTIIE